MVSIVVQSTRVCRAFDCPLSLRIWNLFFLFVSFRHSKKCCCFHVFMLGHQTEIIFIIFIISDQLLQIALLFIWMICVVSDVLAQSKTMCERIHCRQSNTIVHRALFQKSTTKKQKKIVRYWNWESLWNLLVKTEDKNSRILYHQHRF